MVLMLKEIVVELGWWFERLLEGRCCAVHVKVGHSMWGVAPNEVDFRKSSLQKSQSLVYVCEQLRVVFVVRAPVKNEKRNVMLGNEMSPWMLDKLVT